LESLDIEEEEEEEVNADFVYIPVEATLSTSTVCPNHYSQYSNENGLLLCLLCPDSDSSWAV